MTKSKDNDKGSRSKITKHEGTSLQRRQRQRQELNDKSNLNDLTKECHNELTSGDIVSLKILSRTRKHISLAIDKGLHTRLVAGIDHGKAGRGLAEKDTDIAHIMDSLRLEGPSAKTLEVSRLQPAYEQLLLPIHWKEDNVVIRETSLSNSLTVVYDRVQKVKEGALSHRLYIFEDMGPLVDPLSSENLIGEASTSGVPPVVATTTALSTTFVYTSSAEGFSFPQDHLEQETLGLRQSTPRPVEPDFIAVLPVCGDISLSFATICITFMCDLFDVAICT
nr:hypothetical protein [Tanacetum cinerariifolium]